jgi:hypothetical protein
MRALVLTLVCCLSAVPATAQEFEVDITGGTGDQQPGSVAFDIDSVSGTQIYNANGSFSFTNIAISNFMANINGTPYLSASTATAVWQKDPSPFGQFFINGMSGSLFSGATDIDPSVTIDPNSPLYSFLSQGILPLGLGSLGNMNFDSETVKVTTVPTSVPEPGVISLMALGGALLLLSRRLGLTLDPSHGRS